MNPAMMPTSSDDAADGDELGDAIAERRQKYGDIEATYDASDNKVRLRCFSGRLPREVYARVKAAGFSWAPKQELFVAPAWTPEREDLALELAGDIDDEDTSLVDRAEERSERFDGYQESRAADAERAHKAVAAIADNIPLGQPILVGHHSERHARRDAKRIENGMRKAVKMWKTSEYWARRAAGAIAHACYKELPAVRARRIKGLEAEGRKVERARGGAVAAVTAWTGPGLDMRRALMLASDGSGFSVSRSFPLTEYPRQPQASQYEGPMGLWSALDGGVITPEQARDILLPAAKRAIERCDRWIEHIENRLVYERAMLADGGGLKGAAFAYEVGGRVQRRGKWFVVTKVNRREGEVISVTVAGHFASTVSLDEVQDYRPPTDGDAEKVKAATAKGPLCNYPGPGFVSMIAAEWKALPRWSDAKYTQQHKATEAHGRHRTKFKPSASFANPGACVFITDAKRVDPPAPASSPAPALRVERDVMDAEEIRRETERLRLGNAARAAREAKAAPFRALEAAAMAGVTVVSAPQLFPTPRALARRLVEVADIEDGARVLEPSAGTGVLVEEIRSVSGFTAEVTAVEINRTLADALGRINGGGICVAIHCRDFTEMEPSDLGDFDRIVMNPPFERGADVRHIKHALRFIRPGGRLVAVCAASRREVLEPLALESGGTWEDLPDGTFSEQGTNVRVAMVVIDVDG